MSSRDDGRRRIGFLQLCLYRAYSGWRAIVLGRNGLWMAPKVAQPFPIPRFRLGSVLPQDFSVEIVDDPGPVYGRGFAATRLRAMELITILNRCHRFRGCSLRL